MTASAVSQQIRQLEDQLGVKLFRRLVAGLALSDEGRVLLPHVRQGFEAFRQGIDSILDPQMERKLKLLVLSSFATKWLVPRLGKFGNENPSIEISLFHHHVPPDFGATDFDMAILWGQGHWPDCDAYFLMDELVFPVCSPQLVPTSVELGNIASFAGNVILRSTTHSQWSLWLEAAGLSEAEIRRSRMFDDAAMMIDAAIDGQGIGLARSALVADALASGKLIAPFGPALESPLSYYMVVPADRPISPTVETFMEWAAGEARTCVHSRIRDLAIPPIAAQSSPVS